MSDEETDLRRRIIAIIVRLDLVSHVSAKDYDAASSARDTSEAPGGRKPSHGGQDRPRGMEVVDFRESYELHSADHFRRRLAGARSVKALEAILVDAQAALKIWHKSPDDPNPEPGSFGWKRQIAREVESGQRSIENAKRFYSISERTVYRYLADYGVTRLEDSRQ